MWIRPSQWSSRLGMLGAGGHWTRSKTITNPERIQVEAGRDVTTVDPWSLFVHSNCKYMHSHRLACAHTQTWHCALMYGSIDTTPKKFVYRVISRYYRIISRYYRVISRWYRVISWYFSRYFALLSRYFAITFYLNMLRTACMITEYIK